MDQFASYLMAMSRSPADRGRLLLLGAEAAAEANCAAAVLTLTGGDDLQLGALSDAVPERGALLRSLLGTLDLTSDSGPFADPLRTGRNALLDIPALAFGGPAGQWAKPWEAAGVASLGVTPLVTGDTLHGLLLTMRMAGEQGLNARALGEQARLAGQLATFLDTATALTQMRHSSLVVDAMPDAIIGFSRERDVILWNGGAERMYGITEAEAIGRPLDELVTTEWGPPGASAGGARGPAISLINKGVWTGRVRQRSRAGKVLYADVSIASIIEGGVLRGAVSINRDISALVASETARAEHDRKLQALLDASLSPTAVLGSDGLIAAVNSAWSSALALGVGTMVHAGVGHDYLAALRAIAPRSSDAAHVLGGIEGILGGRAEDFEHDYDQMGPDGSLTSHMIHVARMPGAGGGAYVTHSDITTRKNLERALAHQAGHDALTGLRTRRRLEQDLAGLLASGASAGALLVDLNRLKDVNDTLGHAAGDKLLVLMSQRLRQFPNAAMVGRMAGDEFAVIVSGVADRAALSRLAGDLTRLVTAPLAVAGREVWLGASVGLALSADIPAGEDAPADLLRAADTALYRAKERGGNAVVAYDPGLRADVERRMQLASWLSGALSGGQLSVEFEPQFACRDGRQVGSCAQIRWHHADAGVVSDAEFTAIAEESGSILSIGSWLLGQACSHARRSWEALPGQSGKRGPGVSVGVSIQQLADADFVAQVRATLLRCQLPPASLTLELPAAALAADLDDANQAVTRLRADGVRICLADFGSGYTSLAYLARFSVDEVKIDELFLRDIERDPRARALAEGMVRIGHALGLRVVATGVSTLGQLRILAGIGTDAYQGPLGSAAPLSSNDLGILVAGLS